jgi:hypothetical protein
MDRPTICQSVRMGRLYKISISKSDTCFSLVTWEGVVQKMYR